VRHCTYGPGASWCARTDELFGVEGMHVLDVTLDPDIGGGQSLDKWLPLGDPNSEIEVTWHVYQQVRSIYTATSPAAGRKTAEKVLESLHTCPISEVAKLGRTLRQWRTEILAYFDTGGVSNGGTEAINGVIEKTRRLAHGFRNFTNYRIRILLAADGTHPYRRPPTKTRSAGRADPD
jgi:transposase